MFVLAPKDMKVAPSQLGGACFNVDRIIKKYTWSDVFKYFNGIDRALPHLIIYVFKKGLDLQVLRF